MPRLSVLAAVLVIGLAAAPAQAQEMGTYVCTNNMGGNPFTLVIDGGEYRVQSKPDAYVKIRGVGTLIRDPNRTYLMVGSGPLLDEWQVVNIYGMQSNTLTLSGGNGLYHCEPKTKS